MGPRYGWTWHVLADPDLTSSASSSRPQTNHDLERPAPGLRHPTGLTNSTNGIDESVVKLPPVYGRRMDSPASAFSLVTAGFEWWARMRCR